MRSDTRQHIGRVIQIVGFNTRDPLRRRTVSVLDPFVTSDIAILHKVHHVDRTIIVRSPGHQVIGIVKVNFSVAHTANIANPAHLVTHKVTEKSQRCYGASNSKEIPCRTN